jgi:protein involved in ribonucleotide reduction
MAVLAEVPGLEVEILVNGQPLREYEDYSAEVPAQTIERYVEAQSDAQFEIHYTFKAPFPADRPISMIATIDGNDVDEPLVRPVELFQENGHISRGVISNIGSRWVVQKYCFSAIQISEDNNVTCSITDTDRM